MVILNWFSEEMHETNYEELRATVGAFGQLKTTIIVSTKVFHMWLTTTTATTLVTFVAYQLGTIKLSLNFVS